MTHDAALRQHLDELLVGGHAHVTFERAVADLPRKLQGQTVGGFPHSAWMLIEHLRIAQFDIVDFCRNPQYRALKWPQEYWPESPDPPDVGAWKKSIERCIEDFNAMRALVKDPRTDLYARIPWGDGQTILREAMLVADHNAYHVGQIIVLRRQMGAWKD